MKRNLLVLISLSISCFGFSQEYKRMIDQGTFTVQEIQTEAEQYFDTKGRGRGTGYKQFKRWEYNALRMQDENGYLKSDAYYIQELNQFNSTINTEGRATATITGNWEPLGPDTITLTGGYNPGVGRITSLAIDDSNINHMIIGAETGGVWKTTDKGATWTPLSDNFTNMRVYALAMDPVAQNTYYWGASSGTIYKSTDGGSTWAELGDVGSGRVNRILIDPNNTSKMYCTAQNNGIYKSVDGGVTWSIAALEATGMDVEFKPGDTNTVYAAGSGFHRSTDGGATWNAIAGFGGGEKLIGVSPADPNVVYVVEASGSIFGGFYVSTDSGATFTQKNHVGSNYFGYSTAAADSSGQAPRDMAIAVSPTNINEVHIAGINTWRSTDGGDTFVPTSDWTPGGAAGQGIGYCHADVDDMMFYGNNELFVISDGGIYVATDTSTISANYYTELNNMGIHQFYKIGVSQTNPVVVSGGSQDNGLSTLSAAGQWEHWNGGDGMESFVDKNDTSILYGSQQFGNICKSTNAGNSYFYLGSVPEFATGNWITPFEQDPIVNDVIYVGFDSVYKSINGGTSWLPISQDFGGNLDHIKIAPSNSSIIFASRWNQLYKTTVGFGTWATLSGFAGSINSIAIHPTDPNKIAIATTGAEKVYVSDDGGSTWTSYRKNLPDFSALALAWHDNGDDGLYIGMNYGVYYIDANLTDWQPFSNLLPNVIVNELEINTADGKLYAGTYGRGLWRTNLYDSALSVDEVTLLNKINVYPNPTSDMLTIDWYLSEATEIRLFNPSGQILKYEKDIILEDYQIDMTNLANGIYFLRINTAKGMLTKKIVKQ